MQVVFFGTGEIGLPSLERLHGSECHVSAVVTQPDRPAGRSLKPTPSPIKIAALRWGIPVIQPSKIRSEEAIQLLRDLKADIFVVAAYGQILPASVLEIPPLGCINIHASLLPRHRGASPIQSALLAGDFETGVTIMSMDEGLDTGDILLQRACLIEPGETAGALHDRLALLAPESLAEVLKAVQSGNLRRCPQDDGQATYSPKLKKSDGILDWANAASDLERRVRAFSPWPGAHCFLPDGKLLKIHCASAVESGDASPGVIHSANDGDLEIGTGSGRLALHEVQPAGGRRMPAAEFLRGHPLQVGQSMGAARGNP